MKCCWLSSQMPHQGSVLKLPFLLLLSQHPAVPRPLEFCSVGPMLNLIKNIFEYLNIRGVLTRAKIVHFRMVVKYHLKKLEVFHDTDHSLHCIHLVSLFAKRRHPNFHPHVDELGNQNLLVIFAIEVPLMI
jgi:hypothetical protein